jgi:hypothetical protein
MRLELVLSVEYPFRPVVHLASFRADRAGLDLAGLCRHVVHVGLYLDAPRPRYRRDLTAFQDYLALEPFAQLLLLDENHFRHGFQLKIQVIQIPRQHLRSLHLE